MKKKLLALMVMGMMLLATAAPAFALGGSGGATREAADQVAAATKGRRPLDASTVLPKNTTSSSSFGE
jgi:hypothetical protein